MQPVILDQGSKGPGTDAEAGSAGTIHRPGRPRSEQAEQAIIEATLDLFAEQGFEGVCVEAVAARAGVGKATIYRRWSSKSELVVDAIAAVKPPLVHPDTGNVRDDLVEVLVAGYGRRAEPVTARLLVGLCMELQRNPEIGQLYRERLAGPRRQVIIGILQRGIDRGELRADITVEDAVDLLVGPLFYRQLVGAQAPDRAAIRRLVDLVVAGVQA
jgi:AcrR family transcriptional regulator